MTDINDLKHELNVCKDLASHHNKEMENKTFEQILENGFSEAIDNAIRIKKLEKLILKEETK